MVFAETLRKGDRAMAKDYDTSVYKKLLLHFMGESDPLYSMLQWLTERMMEVEAEIVWERPRESIHRIGRPIFRRPVSGDSIPRWAPCIFWSRRFDRGGYVPFFVTEKKRSEQALVRVLQEAFINGVSTRKMERLARSLGIEDKNTRC